MRTLFLVTCGDKSGNERSGRRDLDWVILIVDSLKSCFSNHLHIPNSSDRRVITSQHTSFISPAVLSVLMWSQQCILHPSSHWLSKPLKLLLILVIKLLKGSRVQNWCWQCFGLPLHPEFAMGCNAHTHCSSLKLQTKWWSRFSLPSLPPSVYALVSVQQSFWLKERWSYHYCGFPRSPGIWC